MKKIGMLLFVLVATLSVKAQVYVGGNLSWWHIEDGDNTSFILAPELGYEFNDKWAVGAQLLYGHYKQGTGDHKIKANGFAFAPYARFSFFENKIIRCFVDGGVGVSSYKVKHADSESGFELGLKPGIAIKLGEHFSLIAKYGFLGYRDEYLLGDSGYGFAFSSEDLSIGFHYTF